GAALGTVGREALEAGLRDPEPSVREAAASGLEKLTGARPKLEAPPAAAKRLPVDVPAELADVPELVVERSRGTFVVELFWDAAPVHVANVLALAGRGFYDGLTWHRVVSDFVVQGGCPRGDGWGDPGYTIPDEPSALRYSRGTLGMPKAGKD